jgi:hypothetical protein
MAVHMTAGSGLAYNFTQAPFTTGPDFNIIGQRQDGAVRRDRPRAAAGTAHPLQHADGRQPRRLWLLRRGCAGTLGITHVINTTSRWSARR